MLFVFVTRLSSFENQRALRGSKATHPAHNRCPINFVVGGLPLTATITVVKGCWRPPREDVRARSFSSLSLSDATLYQYYWHPALSFIHRVRCLSVSLFLFVGLFSLFFFSFSARPPTIVSRKDTLYA